ncbi:GNAT family N-acetyltransferase [Streptomyces agglomeratus]|uniref:GNAT family N-acetyltransferase n=1 Tax=Streptomyces agglomeratus TaxID=285458 RepID=A0A1E5PDJ8_9ACTN|nr:GNAT family N-acetyltransferase [Streptomyces agglomeratus]OEJ27621.1 GNAT family N-acetyltransferase [Streptomyces agglomeratus]OEJ38319.1 GNAT family N-acetyltransferase [Streptomyces agglomeratus]OEJ47297.1 GNAT family N-acetyltransferase [Streptomyces agglomeratus]OEJ50847.1 GNAT family N-acetyltransferase [Streptomyces agglomeratus]OEJ58210.1 GNAT family N-acetyltransferase [Streptomyces agglomeratus]
MTDDTIRPATSADVPRVKAVTDAAYHHYIERIGVVPVPMEADHAANVAAGRVFVTGDPVVGVLVLVPHEDHLYLDSVAVHPDAQGTGTGRRLLAFVETYARSLGLNEVRLMTNAKMWENRRMYDRYGYEQVERRVEGEYDRFHYRKRLPA